MEAVAHKVDPKLTERFWDLWWLLSVLYDFHDGLSIVAIFAPWWFTRNHLYYAATQAPYIAHFGALLMFDDFRCHPVRRAMYGFFCLLVCLSEVVFHFKILRCGRADLYLGELLGCPKVRQLNPPFSVYKKIGTLQIPMDNVL